MQIVDPGSIVVAARFDEATMDAIRPGQAAAVRFASQPIPTLRRE
jgi:multidrug resistance efflux pump